MKVLDENGVAHLWSKVEDAIEDANSGSGSGGGGGLSSIVAGTGAGSEIFNQDENNTLDPATVTSKYAHVEGYQHSFLSTGEKFSVHIEGGKNRLYGKIAPYAHIEGYDNVSNGTQSSGAILSNSLHMEGASNTILNNTYIYNGSLHIEGAENEVVGICSHIEGACNRIGQSSSAVRHGILSECHIEGSNNTIRSLNTATLGSNSHIEGYQHSFSQGMGSYNHIEGMQNGATNPMANVCHVEGYNNTDPGCSYQHIQGYFADTSNSSQLAHIVGNGSADARSNAHTLDWDGNAWYEGKVTCGTEEEPVEITSDQDLTTKKYVDDAIAAAIGGIENGAY